MVSTKPRGFYICETLKHFLDCKDGNPDVRTGRISQEGSYMYICAREGPVCHMNREAQDLYNLTRVFSVHYRSQQYPIDAAARFRQIQ